jgi:hypothetical protein
MLEERVRMNIKVLVIVREVDEQLERLRDLLKIFYTKELC